MNDKLITVAFSGKIVPVKPINEQFTLCKCFVMALGKNGNKTSISKDAVDDALPSLFNVPVVGHLYEDEDGNVRLGGHDMVLEKDEDGKYKFRVVTVPYGTVPQQENVHYEEVEEKDGTKNTYLVADIILWTGRYPQLLDAIYSEDIFFAQSMEILPKETERKDGYLHVKKFQYSALCLLNKSDDSSKDVKPCFKSARVEPYKFSETENWMKLFGEFKEQLAKSYSAVSAGKGGKETLNTETIKAILLEFGLADDTQLPFEVTDGMTEDEFRGKVKEFAESNGTGNTDDGSNPDGDPAEPTGEPSGEPAGEPAGEPNGEPANGDDGSQSYTDNGGEPGTDPVATEPLKFSVELTYEEKRKALYEALKKYEIWDEKFYSYYSLIDFDNSYVYSIYHFSGKEVKDEIGTIRIPYSFADEKVVLDMSSQEKVRQVWLTKEDEEKLEADKVQLAELAQYKADRIQDDKQKSYSAVIAEFADLGEIDEYKTVVKDAMQFESVEALTEKLFAIRGKNMKKPVKKPIDSIRIPVGFSEKSPDSERDEFMRKYLPSKQ